MRRYLTLVLVAVWMFFVVINVALDNALGAAIWAFILGVTVASGVGRERRKKKDDE